MSILSALIPKKSKRENKSEKRGKRKKKLYQRKKKHNYFTVLTHHESGEGNSNDISFLVFLNIDNITFPRFFMFTFFSSLQFDLQFKKV